MSDHFQKLLVKKGTFNEISEQTSATLTRVKQQNDQLQHNCDLELDNTIIKLIQQQREQIRKQIALAKENILDLEKGAKGFDQRKQAKKLKQFYIKEVDRNKQIMRTLVMKSFGSFSNEETQEDIDEKTVDNVFPQYSVNLTEEAQQPQKVVNVKMLKQEYFMADFENQLIREKQEDLDRLEREALNLNQIMGQLAVNVHEQEQHLDLITEHTEKTKTNLVAANKELNQAEKMSQQGRKKYIVLALVAFLITSATVVSALFYFDLISF